MFEYDIKYFDYKVNELNEENYGTSESINCLFSKKENIFWKNYIISIEIYKHV
jgi:hypothetical protein